MRKTYRGHNIINAGGYPAIYLNGKVVRIHILQMEHKLGRPLKKGEVVHHLDENKQNYQLSNLICFASHADHAGFHKGCKIYFDDEGIAHSVRKNIMHKTTYKICPICGGLMSSNAKFTCSKCYVQPSLKPDKQTLVLDLDSLHTFTEIGNKYHVTGNTVKKWLKSYGIYKRRTAFRPSRQELVHYLQTHNISETAIYFNTMPDTVSDWIKSMNIIYNPEAIVCVETGYVYPSMLQAAKDIYPTYSQKGSAYKIGKAIKTGAALHGYHWRLQKKLVS